MIDEGPFQNITQVTPEGEPCFLVFSDGTLALFDTMGRGITAERSNSFFVPLGNTDKPTILSTPRACVVAAASSSALTHADTLVAFDIGLNQRALLSYPGSRVKILGPSGPSAFVYEVSGGSEATRGIYRATLTPSGLSQNYKIEDPVVFVPAGTLEGRTTDYTAPGTRWQPLQAGGVATCQLDVILSDPTVVEEEGQQPPAWWPPDWEWSSGSPGSIERAELYRGAAYQAYTGAGQQRGSRLYRSDSAGEIFGLGFENGTAAQVRFVSSYNGRLHASSLANGYSVVLTEGGGYSAVESNPFNSMIGQNAGGREITQAAAWLNSYAFPGHGIGLANHQVSSLDFTSGAAIPRAAVCVRFSPYALEAAASFAFFQGGASRNGVASISRDGGGNVIFCTADSVSRPGQAFGVDRIARVSLRRFPSLVTVPGSSALIGREKEPRGIAYTGGTGQHLVRITWDLLDPVLRPQT